MSSPAYTPGYGASLPPDTAQQAANLIPPGGHPAAGQPALGTAVAN